MRVLNGAKGENRAMSLGVSVSGYILINYHTHIKLSSTNTHQK